MGAVIYVINPIAPKIDVYTKTAATTFGIFNRYKKLIAGDNKIEIIKAKKNQTTISLAKKRI